MPHQKPVKSVPVISSNNPQIYQYILENVNFLIAVSKLVVFWLVLIVRGLVHHFPGGQFS